MKANRFLDNIQNTKFNFVKNAMKFFYISLAIILVGIVTFIFAGFNLGLDFTGGTIVKIKYGTVLEENGKYAQYSSEVKDIFKEYGITIDQIQKEDSDDNAAISVRFQSMRGYTDAQINELVDGDIKADLIAKFNADDSNPSFEVYAGQQIGATASSELILNAFLAILIAAVLIMIYIAWRFEMLSGLATLIAIIHDVLIVCAFMIITRIEINSAFIAAIITVIGYSINNTIIIFDRLRENQKIESVTSRGTEYLVNTSIKQTLLRSIYTSATTLLAVLVLAIIGVSAIQVFLWPIVIGIVAGTYSSVFLSAPLWQWILMRYSKRKDNLKYKFTRAKDDKNEPIEVEIIEEK